MKFIAGIFRKQTPWIVIAVYIGCFLWLKNPSDPWDRVINSDGKGYYAYLPALFIYHDLSFSFIDGYENNYYPKGGDLYKDFRVDTGSGIADKYFPGLAILWLPFFLIAHFIALVFGFSADGYSAPYQLLIALSALFYLCCGLLLLRKILTKYTNNETIAAWVILLTGLATNLIYYTLVEGSMVHVYNFFLVNAFILLVLEVRERPRLLNFTMISVVLALIIIIRPQNGLLIFSVPFLAGSRERLSELIKAFFRKPAIWSISLFAALIILLIPLIIWHLQTGSFFVYTYGNEHFNLLQPHLFKFLLGFEKGWLIYTPMAAISLLGFIPLFRDSRYAFFTLAGFLLLLVYVLSSWWAWNYTSQHSQRVMIDFLAVVAILLVVLFRNVRHGRAFHLINLLFVILILINFLQLYQQKVWVYPKGRVTARAYFKNFFSLKPNGTFYVPEIAIESRLTFRTDFEAVAPLFGAHNVKETSQAFSGTHVLVVDTARNVPVFARALSAMRSSEPILLRIGGRFLETDKAAKLRVIVKYGQSADNYGANEYVLSESLRFGKWDYSEYVSYIPYIQSVNDSIFIELQSKQGTVLADDFIVEFITLKPGEQFDWFGKPPEIVESSVLTKCDMDNSAPKGWRNTDKAVAGDSYSGEKSCLINLASPYSIMFEDSLVDYFDAKDGYIRVEARIKPGSSSKCVLVFDYRKGSETVKYVAKPMPAGLAPGTWNLLELYDELPVNKPDIVRIYFWHTSGNEPVNIDDFAVEFASYLPKRIVHHDAQEEKKSLEPLCRICCDFEDAAIISSSKVVTATDAPSGSHVTRLTEKERFSYALKIPLNFHNQEISEALITAKVFSDCMYSKATFVADFRNKGESVSYNPLYMRSINEKGKWVELLHEAVLPPHIDADTLLVYFYLPQGDEQLMADDVCVRLLPLLPKK